MSYDIYLEDQDGNELEVAHHEGGGTTIMGGYSTTWMNVTWNYAPHYYKHLDSEQGIRWLYGKTGAETAERLEACRDALKEDYDDEDYWNPTEGNARRAIATLAEWARLHPEGVWSGD